MSFNLVNAAVAASDLYNLLTVEELQMTSVIHSISEVRLLSLSGHDVQYVQNMIQFYQLASHHSLYINVILIQFCERSEISVCTACHEDSDLCLFSQCIQASEHFDKTCDNCK